MDSIPQEILEEVIRTKILYFNLKPVSNKYVDMMRQGGHDVVTTSRSAHALAMMHRQSFDALVMDCAQDTVDILNFTAKAHGLQPSLAVFLADEWGDELATGLEELTHVLTMLEDDEFAMLKVESLMADANDGSSSYVHKSPGDFAVQHNADSAVCNDEKAFAHDLGRGY